MRKYRSLTSASLCFLLILFFSLPVYANSSWRWISETRPYDVLPFVVIVTLLAETVTIGRWAAIREYGRVFCFVLVGNLCSFAAPYLFQYLVCASEQLYSFSQALEHLPVYIVGAGYLVVTLLVELPIVYFSLRKSAQNKPRLLPAILCINVITTIFTAIVERIFCRGMW